MSGKDNSWKCQDEDNIETGTVQEQEMFNLWNIILFYLIFMIFIMKFLSKWVKINSLNPK